MLKVNLYFEHVSHIIIWVLLTITFLKSQIF